MKNKISKIFITIYKILKTEYWPYRYYFLIWIIVITTFTLDMITWSRIIRFVIICIILLIYKKMHDYLEKKTNINVKYLIYWMWINILTNPVLYIIWKKYFMNLTKENIEKISQQIVNSLESPDITTAMDIKNDIVALTLTYLKEFKKSIFDNKNKQEIEQEMDLIDYEFTKIEKEFYIEFKKAENEL